MASGNRNLIQPIWQNVSTNKMDFLGKSGEKFPYLFSLKDEFTNFVENSLLTQAERGWEIFQGEIENAKELVENQIRAISQQCNNFYRLCGIDNALDTFQFRKDGIWVNYCGAREFSKLFLEQLKGGNGYNNKFIWEPDQQNKSFRTEIFTLMSDGKYIEQIIKAIDVELKQAAPIISKGGLFLDRSGNVIIDQAAQQQVALLLTLIAPNTSIQVAQITDQVIEDWMRGINSFQNIQTSFQKGPGRFRRPIPTPQGLGNIAKILSKSSSLTLSVQLITKMQELVSEGNRYYKLQQNQRDNAAIKNMLDVTQKFREGLQQEIKGTVANFNQKKVPGIMWKYFLQEIDQNKQKFKSLSIWLSQARQQGVLTQYQRRFENYFKQVLAPYGNVQFSDYRQTTGMVHEHSFILDLSLFSNMGQYQNALDKVVQILSTGQGLNQQGKKLGYDMIFRSIKDPTVEIRVQFKNTPKSFTENGLRDIRLQGTEEFSKLPLMEDQYNAYQFLMLNQFYLRTEGLKYVNGELKKSPLALTSQKINNYLQFIINQLVAYWIGGKEKIIYQTNGIKPVTVEVTKSGDQSYWPIETLNLFYIYNSKYLIPVSVFLLPVYEHFLRMGGTKIKQDLATMTYSQMNMLDFYAQKEENNQKNIVPIKGYAEDIFWAKFNTLQKDGGNMVLRMGQEYGRIQFEDASLETKQDQSLIIRPLRIGTVSFTFTLERLNKILGL